MSDFEEQEYIKACNEFIAKASDEVAFGLITAENPEQERFVVEQVAHAMALLATRYEEQGFGEAPGFVIIDDLAARALAVFKALGHDVDIDEG